MDNRYNETKNYIHNELGITKEWIKSIIEDTVKKEIAKYLNDEEKLENMIANEIRYALIRSENEDLSYLRKTLYSMNNLIKDKVDEAIFKEVKDRLYIGLKDDK